MGYKYKINGHGKLLKIILCSAAIFIVMCYGLAKLEENDKQMKLRLAAEVPVQAEPIPLIEDAKSKVKFYVYTPEKLYSEFKANEVKITHKLSGNTLLLHGKVSKVSLYLGKPVIDMDVPGMNDQIKIFFESNMTGVVSDINVGDIIRVSSNDVSLNPFGSIHLRHSSLF